MADVTDDSTVYVIEDDIEIPPTRALGGGSKYPISRLKVGQSFFVRDVDPKRVSGVRNTLAAAARKVGYAVTSRARTEKIKGKEVFGVRVWRIQDRHPVTKK